ncbi:hypothetical protein JQX13_39760 [Archangium violaceum]|uniref:hypothetical protein n=1 Tax=Archangium violaceum TaxID=83451 RepID=UPI00193C4352|nr:hypothetical protein [Archangium violaceum]QRK06200.1 hypothetical protein JQX13_39760 [Archangium violaceum]
MSPRVLAVVVLLFLPRAVRAETPSCSGLYENGQYEAAVRACERVLAGPERPAEERGLARMYLAASLHVLGYADRVQQQLEALAREHPGMRVDPVRFPPELVALAEGIRERVEAEKLYAAEQAALRERQALERARGAIVLRMEALALVEPLNRVWRPGAGLSFYRGLWEGGAHVWLGGPPAFHLQGGLVPGRGGLRPFMGVRATLNPSAGGYGAGAVVGGRLSLPAGFVALVDVGADYFLIGDEAYQRFALTIHAGLGFDVRLTH